MLFMLRCVLCLSALMCGITTLFSPAENAMQPFCSSVMFWVWRTTSWDLSCAWCALFEAPDNAATPLYQPWRLKRCNLILIHDVLGVTECAHSKHHPHAVMQKYLPVIVVHIFSCRQRGYSCMFTDHPATRQPAQQEGMHGCLEHPGALGGYLGHCLQPSMRNITWIVECSCMS